MLNLEMKACIISNREATLRRHAFQIIIKYETIVNYNFINV